jgi:hypothetical protein
MIYDYLYNNIIALRIKKSLQLTSERHQPASSFSLNHSLKHSVRLAVVQSVFMGLLYEEGLSKSRIIEENAEHEQASQN